MSTRHFVLGRAGMDLYPIPDGTPIENAEQFRSDVGGSAGNIAVALARRGATVELLSAFSDDAVGRFTRQKLAGYGVGTAHCATVAGEARNTLALAETRNDNCQVVIYRNGAADFALPVASVAKIDYGPGDVLVATGTALAREPSRMATLCALAAARQAGALTVLDLDYRPYSWIDREEVQTVYGRAIAQTRLLVGNEEEFAMLDDDGRGHAERRADGLCDTVIYKRGSQGSITFEADTQFETGTFTVEALKPFGAGDAFLGNLLAALSGGAGLADAVREGSAAAAIVVARAGCASAMPDTAALHSFIDNHSATAEPV